MARETTYRIVLEKMDSGLIVVASSDYPALHLAGRSLEHVLETLPSVIEHMFLDKLGQHVKVERAAPKPRKRTVETARRSVRRLTQTIDVQNWDHRTVATLHAQPAL